MKPTPRTTSSKHRVITTMKSIPTFTSPTPTKPTHQVSLASQNWKCLTFQSWHPIASGFPSHRCNCCCLVVVPPWGKLPPCLQVVWSEELQELEMVFVRLEMVSAELVPAALGKRCLAGGSWKFDLFLFEQSL